MGKVPYHNPFKGVKLKDPGGAARQEDKNFYSNVRWLKLRALKLATNPLCERCEAMDETTVAVHVHHVKARKTHPALALDLDNLESLCLPCHTREEMQRRKKP